MTLDEVALQLPLIKAWVAAVEKEIEERLFEGDEFENAKLVEGIAFRQWDGEAEEIAGSIMGQGFTLDQVMPRTLLSPAQMEAQLKADTNGLWKRPKGRVQLAYKGDPRPAVEVLTRKKRR